MCDDRRRAAARRGVTVRGWSTTGGLLLVLVSVGCGDPQAPAATITAAFERDQLLADVRVLSADDMEGRLVASPGGAKARAYILERFAAAGLEPIDGTFEFPFAIDAAADGTLRRGVNVVGRIPGTRGAARAIVVTAHYDHIGVRNGEVYNGADDNASGTAALLAIAQHFRAHQPAHTFVLAALDAEEGGLRGARAFVASPPVPREAIVLNINLDMIGRDPDDILYAAGPSHYPFLVPYIERVAADAPIKLVMGHDAPGRAGMDDWTSSSDHFPFHEAGIPFIYFGVEDFPHHHKPTDDYETLTHDFYVRAVTTIIEALRVFDADLEAIDRARQAR
ncbi:MAG TPA: M28 family peptidase [Vicinamibacterales bacterium]|nr:M28 family peptidase [Vicinamibacterales bacterium]